MGEFNINNMGFVGLVVTILAIIVLIGIAVLTGYSEILRDQQNTSVNAITLAANGSTTGIGTLGQYPFISTVTGCVNATGTDPLAVANYTVISGTETIQGGIELLDTAASRVGEVVNCTDVTYLEDTDGQATADLFITGLGIFGTFMAVIVLAIIGKLIVGLFIKKKE